MIPDSLAPIANHLWQSTLFAGFAGLLTLALRKNPARVRHWVWVAASLKFLIPFSVLMTVGSHVHWRTVPVPTKTNFSTALDQVSQPFSTAGASSPLLATVPPAPNLLPAVLFGIWTCGFVGISCSWLLRLRQIRGAVRAGSPVQLDISIKAIYCRTLLEPGVFGVFRPVLLLPEGIFERLTPTQLKAVIAHELCHVRHKDNLVAVVQMFVETVFWFHPLVWWVGNKIFEERERSCDEEALRLGNEPKVYAEGILSVCKMYAESPLVCVSGVTGADLKKRIEAIMTNRLTLNLNFAKKVALAATGIAALAAPIAIGMLNVPSIRAQSQPAFDVASIKRSGPDSGGGKQGAAEGDGGGRLRFTPGRVTGIKVSARRIILEAYHVTPHQLSGGQNWLDSERFDLEAKTGAGASETQIRVMLQTMLGERFKLAMHRGTQEMPVYALMVGKNGSKLRDWNQDEDGIKLPVPKMARREDAVGYFMDRGKMQTFIDDLSRNPSIDRPVLDKTGLQGAYLFYMAFGPDDNMITATQDQLGLRFESQRAPMDVLVIDHVERPSEN